MTNDCSVHTTKDLRSTSTCVQHHIHKSSSRHIYDIYNMYDQHVHISLRGSPYPHMHTIDTQQRRSALLLCLLQLHPLVTATPSGVAACFSCKQLHGVQHLSKNLHQQEAQCCVQCGVPTNRMPRCGKWSNTDRTRKTNETIT